MEKKKNNMSFACAQEMQDRLKIYRDENKITSVSKLMREMIETHILNGKKTTTVEHNADHLPVVFQIPIALNSDPEALRKWLTVRVNAIVSKLCSSA